MRNEWTDRKAMREEIEQLRERVKTLEAQVVEDEKTAEQGYQEAYEIITQQRNISFDLQDTNKQLVTEVVQLRQQVKLLSEARNIRDISKVGEEMRQTIEGLKQNIAQLAGTDAATVIMALRDQIAINRTLRGE